MRRPNTCTLAAAALALLALVARADGQLLRGSASSGT